LALAKTIADLATRMIPELNRKFTGFNSLIVSSEAFKLPSSAVVFESELKGALPFWLIENLVFKDFLRDFLGTS